MAKYHPTIGVDFGVTEYVAVPRRGVRAYPGRPPRDNACRVDGILLNLYDLSGKPEFADVRLEMVADTQAVMLVFDASSQSSFNAAPDYAQEMAPAMHSGEGPVIKVLCGTKTDTASRAVAEGTAKLWAESHGWKYFETSAQTGEGIQAAITFIVAGLKNPAAHRDAVMPTFSAQQLEITQAILKGSSDLAVLQLASTSAPPSADDVNRAYKKLAALVRRFPHAATGLLADSSGLRSIPTRTGPLAAKRPSNDWCVPRVPQPIFLL